MQCANVNKIRTPVHASTLHYAVLINTLMVSFLNIFGLQGAIINYIIHMSGCPMYGPCHTGPGFIIFFWAPTSQNVTRKADTPRLLICEYEWIIVWGLCLPVAQHWRRRRLKFNDENFISLTMKFLKRLVDYRRLRWRRLLLTGHILRSSLRALKKN